MLPIPAAFFLFLPFFLDQTTAYNPNKSPSRNAVLLSNIQTLTLHANRKTSHRRVSAIPQLTCVGPSKRICSLYIPDVMRCTNQGYDYDENDIQWTCTAELPPEFKLGSTEVVCEGYRDSNDPWILKGSCGVEYRMLLTEEGERKFPYMTGGALDDRSWAEQLWDFVKSPALTHNWGPPPPPG
ncbi:transmembrane protein 66 [Coccidioides immitis H538.4]|uniref:Store-operated calcium entry-associated regulatory factor n=1 Tax=Coccidioides immitis H538.4 TaxID=396776 RepID=A0A0J8RVY3_COCIT|nr:transmembrane protein 66 [Coccidioides immitis H538.4]